MSTSVTTTNVTPTDTVTTTTLTWVVRDKKLPKYKTFYGHAYPI